MNIEWSELRIGEVISYSWHRVMTCCHFHFRRHYLLIVHCTCFHYLQLYILGFTYVYHVSFSNSHFHFSLHTEKFCQSLLQFFNDAKVQHLFDVCSIDPCMYWKCQVAKSAAHNTSFTASLDFTEMVVGKWCESSGFRLELPFRSPALLRGIMDGHWHILWKSLYQR